MEKMPYDEWLFEFRKFAYTLGYNEEIPNYIKDDWHDGLTPIEAAKEFVEDYNERL